MKTKLSLLILLAVFTLSGCGTKVITGSVNDNLTFKDINFTISDNKAYDWLIETENGYNQEVLFGDESKAVLVHISMNTGDTVVSNSNFTLETKETAMEAIPSDITYHEKYNIINFNSKTKGNIDGYLIFAVTKDDLKNKEFTLVASFSNVVFKVPIDLSVDDSKTFTIGDTVNIDDDYEINFKSYKVVTETVKMNGYDVDFGNSELVIFETEITPLNGNTIILAPDELSFVDSNGDLYLPDQSIYDGYNQLINTSISEKTTGNLMLSIPSGTLPEDYSFFIKSSFSRTNFVLKK